MTDEEVAGGGHFFAWGERKPGIGFPVATVFKKSDGTFVAAGIPKTDMAKLRWGFQFETVGGFTGDAVMKLNATGATEDVVFFVIK